ncbi:2,3-bisphosphoglycerate-dependent phosphoglycerate mutase [Zea mays]|uniref:phosphoglycerate mutase (2,3-diphosphoglycerate-dependent) n=1 Tax=Zea mays TaxID=4577 RepID=A0A3L6F5J8_MAIZE|nr:2,3-bisphosphoglycerate-dependent phosphoglycerate mutase [Zea mays]
MRKRNAPTKPTTPVALPVAATVYKKKTRPSSAAPEVGSTTHWSQQTTTSPFRLLPVAPRFRRRYPAISATATRCRRRRSRREDRYRCRRQINWTCKTRACATCGVPEALFCQDSASLVAHMATSTSQHALSSIKLLSTGCLHPDKRNCRVLSVSVGRRCPSARNLGLLCASNSQSSVIQPVQLPRSPKSGVAPKKSGESALILIRHGESLWNEKNLFTGCVDVPLTPKGVDEAIEAGKRICNIPVDVIYTSSLIRAQMTAMLAMMQHRRKKVPIILHNESEQAHMWSQIYSEETKKQSIPVITAWQLNERMYGELQGLNKQETADRFGKEQVHEWRRSYDIPPPNGESLEMCAERAVAYFKDQLTFTVSVLGVEIVDRPLVSQVISLELSTGIPMLYIFKEGKFIRRGSPAGPSEAGVYAYTKNLAQYRQKLDGIVQ